MIAIHWQLLSHQVIAGTCNNGSDRADELGVDRVGVQTVTCRYISAQLVGGEFGCNLHGIMQGNLIFVRQVFGSIIIMTMHIMQPTVFEHQLDFSLYEASATISTGVVFKRTDIYIYIQTQTGA